MKNNLYSSRNPHRAVILMSGSGSNAEKLLDSLKNCDNTTWKPVAIFTDAPLKSRAFEIAEKYEVPFIKLDILEFYRNRGEQKISLSSEKGRIIREEWTNQVRKLLEPLNPDFGILAGFVPLSNITADFPCLNIHPGDLTVEEKGKRILVGLHTIPIENAIIRGFSEIRSSVIIAQSYTGKGGEMDSGPILGISVPVKIDYMDKNIQELLEIHRIRPTSRPVGGYKDLLEDIAKHNQEILKREGDWTVFPPAVSDFASGKFKICEKGKLNYLLDGKWIKVKTIIYSQGKAIPVYEQT